MDWYLALTPLLLLPVFLLYRFTGCLEPSSPIVTGPQTRFDLKGIDEALDCASDRPQAIVRFIAVFPYQTAGASDERYDVGFFLTPTDRDGPEITYQVSTTVPDASYARKDELHRFRGQICLDQGAYSARCEVRAAGSGAALWTGNCQGDATIDPTDPLPPPDPGMEGIEPDFNLRFQWEPQDTADPGSPIRLSIQCFERK